MREGVTTGTCAAGAAKASAIFITSGEIVNQVCVKNLDGREFVLKTFRESDNFFGVVKDSGDDRADITNGVKVLARVEILGGLSAVADEGKIEFVAGEGVGTVTLPGLKVGVGEPAINPVPRKMIELAVREVIPEKSLRVTISIPGGRELALRTFNTRLGIVGGLSILGTSGVVKPMNEKALLDSLSLELSMIASLGFRELYVTFANSGEKALRKIFNVQSRNVIQCGNYIGYVLDEAARLNFEHVIIVGHPGKLLKVAAGNFNTHSKIADGRLEALCTHLALAGASREFIARIFHTNTTNEAIELIHAEGFNFVWDNIAVIISEKCNKRCKSLKVDAIFIDSEGNLL